MYILSVLQIVTLALLVNFVCTNLLTLSLCKKKKCFFQVFKDDILKLPSTLIEKVNDIPGILCDCKSGNTVRNYYYGFLRWKIWGKITWNLRCKCFTC